MRTQKSSRWGAMLLATVVAIITSAVVANATQTITTPNAAFISYSLAPGANSAAITPVTNKSVLVMGCCINPGDQGVGQVSLLHLPGGGMQWEGLEANSTTVTTGPSATPGAHIAFIDFDHLADIQVASADTIRIHNSLLSSVTLVGNVTLIWYGRGRTNMGGAARGRIIEPPTQRKTIPGASWARESRERTRAILNR